MLTRLRIRLHDRRCGHQVYEDAWCETTPVPREFQGLYPHTRKMVSGYRCWGCGWKVIQR